MQAKYVLIQKRGDWQCSSRHAYLQYGTGPLLNLQLSIYLLLQFELHDYFCTILLTCIYISVWIGSTNLAVSHLSAPFLVALCRRKSAFAILVTFWLFWAFLGSFWAGPSDLHVSHCRLLQFILHDYFSLHILSTSCIYFFFQSGLARPIWLFLTFRLRFW